MRPLELWVGVEPTVSRVGDTTMDQLHLSGFHHRLDDIDRLASLGAKRVRFPLLWERTAPNGVDTCAWAWADERLQRLQDLGVDPIVGLVHHGSGPMDTHLLDPNFEVGLARYARAVAQRYPHITQYTPVNEPLTTARFAALYGHWYPHARDDLSFWHALKHQLRATVLAMRAIREVNPGAQLVQTEDLGRTYSTPHLQYQADFENERRWISMDLLMGRVDETHPMWAYLRGIGASEPDILWFAENPCPPDIFGLNSYVTSERFLDERLDHYPQHMHGGNGRDQYVDVEAVRVNGAFLTGPGERLRETYERYGRPVAITEVHLGCTREEQLRWLREVWDDAQAVSHAGVDVRGVTIWSAFGAHDWNSLLTQQNGHYESGVWDVRAPAPRPTAMAALARDLSAGRTPTHPVLSSPGWWRRRERLTYPPHGTVREEPVSGPRLLITGATGTLGQAFARACAIRGLPYHLLDRRALDITDEASIHAALDLHQPWAVINTAGYVRVDDAETDPRNTRENTHGPHLLALACAQRGVPLMTFSSDLVFDGTKGAPYVESDAVNPLNAYGRSKADAERLVLQAAPDALVIRTSAFFGPWDPYNFAAYVVRELQAGRTVRAAGDQVVSPTYVPDLTCAALDLLIDGERGIWHLANAGALSWADFARRVARVGGLSERLVEAVSTADLHQKAARPAASALISERGWIMPSLDVAIEHWYAHTAQRPRETQAAD
ncbi:family 1 glycosylhydrolase [Deinococcus maricopensis]|uniref:dTDP-4-dehydrorhamnose reductase n=1 Tax=Deinococcus maricopensis (strain DSM 21211 / LMG 22137 / NRRL B-23946 / LB-34) TaxID=709986 RepID=E8U7S8_DEIML|nr:family 1 glycosylhydrolase [Deinococcus maricopensis]ADV67117.1 dTDP-4-dehydrorhamnose reductase [Deinococcus maricopensis DSM 21211]